MAVLILCWLIGILCSIHYTAADEELQFCPFFNNRAPKVQPGLQNCTWYKENSCCEQQEIQTTFNQVKALKGASTACQHYINALMCYICAPDQHLYYQSERLTVCEGFCNTLYGACKDAILKGSVIADLYENGGEFCRSRRFRVNTERCFKASENFFIAISEANKKQYISLSSLWLACVVMLLTITSESF